MTQKLLEALKPCPCCGKRAEVKRTEDPYWTQFVQCTSCFIRTDDYADSHAEAMRRDWNNRPINHMKALIQRALVMFQQAYAPAVVHDSEHNNPVISWMAEARTALSDFESQPSGWIKCSERMPEHKRNVLVCYRDGSIGVKKLTGPDDWVKYWQSLPPAPENAG